MELRQRREMNPYANAGGPALPNNLLRLSGTIRENAVDYLTGAIMVVVWIPSVDSAEIFHDTQISGALSATATGLKFDNGINIAEIDTSYTAGDEVVFAIEIRNGAVRVGRIA